MEIDTPSGKPHGKGLQRKLLSESLVRGKKIISSSARWKVGDGESISVVGDKWIPRPPSFTLTDPLPIPKDMKVSELKTHRGEWDVE